MFPVVSLLGCFDFLLCAFCAQALIWQVDAKVLGAQQGIQG